MDLNPVLFAQITNRETWTQIIGINDDDTGDLVSLTDINNFSLYDIAVEIARSTLRPGGGSPYSPYYLPGYYDDAYQPVITAALGSGITIIDTGTIQVRLTKTQMKTLGAGTYDVYCTITEKADPDEARQMFIGRLSVFYGGRNT